MAREQHAIRLLRDERDRMSKELRDCRAGWRAIKEALYGGEHQSDADRLTAIREVLGANLPHAVGNVSGWFDLVRNVDPTGVSGTGRVAEVAEFEDGTAVLRWLSGTPSTVVYDRIEDVVKIHGHGGSTELVPRV